MNINKSLDEEYVFALHLTENGKWHDTDIAIKLLTLYEKYQFPEFLEFDICLCAFLMRSHPIDVRAHLKSLNPTLLESPKNSKDMIYKVIGKRESIKLDFSFPIYRFTGTP